MEKLLLSFFAILMLNACGASGTGSDSAFPIDEYTVVSGGFSAQTRSSLSGSGTVRFNAALASVFGSESFKINAQILANGGSITLVTHATSSSLSDGVKLKLTRSGITVIGTIQVNSGTVTTIASNRLLVFDPTNLKVVIDMHNLVGGTRSLIWDQAAVPYSLALVNVDSSTDTSPALFGSASGLYSGLILDNATVTTSQIGTAKTSL